MRRLFLDRALHVGLLATGMVAMSLTGCSPAEDRERVAPRGAKQESTQVATEASPELSASETKAGGSFAADYPRDLKPILDAQRADAQRFRAEIENLDGNGSAMPRLEESIQRHLDSLKRTLALLNALEPPAELKEVHQTLSRGFTRQEANATEILDALRTKDPSALGTALEGTAALGERFAQELKPEVEKAGFDWETFAATNTLIPRG